MGNSTLNLRAYTSMGLWDWSDSTAERGCAWHIADPGLIPGILPYSPEPARSSEPKVTIGCGPKTSKNKQRGFKKPNHIQSYFIK